MEDSQQDKETLAESDIPLPTIETNQASEVRKRSPTKRTWPTPDALNIALPSSPIASTSRSPRISPAKPSRPASRPPSQQSLASRNSPTPTLKLNTRRSMSSLRGKDAQTPTRSPALSGRRSSASLFAGGFVKIPSPNEMPARPVLTAAIVAKEYFSRDIDTHETLESEQLPDTAVIFHDACYGHRFSRPRTSKANLNTIVERPERILATVLGVSAAYVLLGGRHVNGCNAPHPTALPGAVPFVIRKSSRSVDITSTAVTNVHGMKWMAELKEMCEAAESKLTQNGKELVRPQDSSGNNRENKPKLHEGDLYLCAESLAAFEGALGGVLDAVDTAFKPSSPRRVFACVRPPGHHCSDDYPSGFCWLNNVHVGISHAALEHGLTHAAIFDFDLHHGDGSQSITWAHNAKVASLPRNAALSKKTSIGYYSLHDINSYPCEWGDEDKVRNASLCIENAHGQSIWNVHLQPWKTDGEFWKLYEDRYSVLIDKMRSYLRTQFDRFRSMGPMIRPRGAIFISAGFDASEWEGQGMQRHKVNVPTEFYARVTRDIVKLSEEEGLGVDGRVISVLEGGYSDRALASGVLSHVCGLASEQAIRTSKNLNTNFVSESIPQQYDEHWWSVSRLEELERCGESSPPTPVKKIRPGAVPTYYSPTQSFVAKAGSQTTYQRSVANSLSRHSSAAPQEESRSPTPPPPEVEWTTASYELSQLMIPHHRQTRSCRAEDLNAKATEARKSRQSNVGVAPPLSDESLEQGLEKMNLRDRRTKAPAPSAEASRASSRAESRAAANRRKTFGGVEIPGKDVPKVPNRRLSIASTSISLDDSDVKATSPSVEPVAKVRAAAKPRAPRKTTTAKPPVPKTGAAIKKPVTAFNSEVNPNTAAVSGDGNMDELVSGMKNIRLKLNPPSKELHDKREASKTAVRKDVKDLKDVKDVKKPVRAPRKPAVKKLPTKEPLPKANSASETVSAATKPAVASELEQQQVAPQQPSAFGGFQHQQSADIDFGQTLTNPKYQNTAMVDDIVFNQAPFDPTLAAYLAPNSADAPSNQLPTFNPAFYNVPPTMGVEQIQNQSHAPLPVMEHIQQKPGSVMPPSSQPYTPIKSHILPTFSPYGPIPFANPGRDTVQHMKQVPTQAAIPTHQMEPDNGFGPDHGEGLTLYPTLKEEKDDEFMS